MVPLYALLLSLLNSLSVEFYKVCKQEPGEGIEAAASVSTERPNKKVWINSAVKIHMTIFFMYSIYYSCSTWWMETWLCCFGWLDQLPLWSLCFFSQATRWLFRSNDNRCLILLASLDIEELCNHLGTTGLNEDKIWTFVFCNVVISYWWSRLCSKLPLNVFLIFVLNHLVHVVFCIYLYLLCTGYFLQVSYRFL